MSMATEPASATNTCISDRARSPLSTVHHAARSWPVPVGEYPDGSSYLVRFEVPGIDPAADLAVCVEAGTLVVQAQRTDCAPEGYQSEFRYGQFARHVRLPGGADVRNVSATYRNGILTVRIGMAPEHQQPAQVANVEIQQ